MANYDSADLLARCKREAYRPATDQEVADADWYAWLTEGQAHWTNTIAAQAPWVLMGAPTALTSTDGGLTFPFPNDADGDAVFPLAVELYDTTTPARLLRPCAYWDSTGDYVWEGNKIRFPQGQKNPLAVAPVARWVTPPGVLSATSAPTLQPKHARLLVLYRAVAIWAERAGMRDPQSFYRLEQKFWLGNPAIGDVGLLGALKMQNPFLGGMALPGGGGGGILEGVSTGAGYQRYPP